MASQPPPGSTGGEPRNPPAPSAPAAPRVTQSQRCILLGDWWLERVEGREGKIRVAGDAPQTSQRNSVARRVFRSGAIVKRHDDRKIDTEDGYRILIGRLLNTAKTRENGFSEEVCEWFLFGFPIQWLELVNPNMKQQNEQAQSQSESTANAPRHSVEYYMEMLSSDSFTKSMNVYAFMESDFFSSAGYTSNKDGPAIQSLSNLTDGIAGNMAASSELYGGRANMPEKPLTAPGETCSGQENDQHESRTSMPEKPLTAPGETCSGQENGQHESTQIDASEQGIDNLSIGSISVNQSTSSICPNSKEHSILAPSKTESVEKEGYRSRVGCCQAEEDADIHQHENMQSYSTEQEMVAPPVDAAIVKDNLNSTAAALEEPGTPQFGAVRGSDDTTVRRLRSGKVFGTPSGGPMRRRYKKRKMQQASNKNMVPNEGGTSTTANLTSHGNDSSAAGIVGKDGSTEISRSLMLDISKDSLSKVSPEGNSFTNANLEDDSENSPAADANRGKELILHGVSPADGLFDHNVCEELADDILDLCYKSSAEVSLEDQGHEKRTQYNLLNYDVVPLKVITACTDLDVSNPNSSLKRRAKRKRITKASSPACANLDASNPKLSLKGRGKQKRTTESSSPLLVPKENVGTLVPSHLIGLEIEEQSTSPLVGQNSGDEVLQSAPRSRMAKTPLSYVHQSPLTCSKGKALSIFTLESVKMKQPTSESVEMKRSRSGRLIVPRLDPGFQNIIYDPDGSICGITNFEAQSPQGIGSAPPSKRSRRLSPIHNRLLTF